MGVQIRINRSTDEKLHYIGWAPAICLLNSTDGDALTVVLQNRLPSTGGQVVFLSSLQSQPADSLELNLPADGTNVEFFIAAKMNTATGKAFAGKNSKDSVIEIMDKNTGNVIDSIGIMVRMRKNANELTVEERDRFLSALVRLNTPDLPSMPNGKYVDFQRMHDENANTEIHFRFSFLPWHRAMLLDIERRLQAIDPAITLPYWQFDNASPNIFTRDFLGVPLSNGLIDFSNTNPMINWSLRFGGEGQGNMRIRRRNQAQGFPWSPTQTGAIMVQNNEQKTLNRGTSFADFADIEGDPHGSAHVSFTGQLSDIGRAPADPLFFLLHANIDRLWSKWQWLNAQRFDISNTDAFPNIGNGPNNSGGPNGLGDFTLDSLWPWNGENSSQDPSSPRPPTSPGGPFPQSTLTVNPGTTPTVGSLIDYQGNFNLSANLMFAYEDVPFEF